MQLDVLQVFLDRQYIGCLDYKTNEVMLPEAKVLLLKFYVKIEALLIESLNRNFTGRC